MTKREFLNAIVAGNVTDEIKAFAEKEIASLDARNAKRASTPSKNQQANVAIKKELVEKRASSDDYRTAGEIASLFGLDEEGKAVISVQKASALLRQLVADDVAEVTDLKVPKKGKQKGYKLITEK